VNAILDAIEAFVIKRSVEMPQVGWGEFESGLRAPRPPEGLYGNPYIMGSLTQGSSKENSGPPKTWGGSGDSTPSPAASPLTDTWHREKPPLTIANVQTVGVKLDLTRIYITVAPPGGYMRYTFTRTATYDNLGALVSISAETLEETDYASGSGSAGGGI
jgi:hypothetical protein